MHQLRLQTEQGIRYIPSRTAVHGSKQHTQLPPKNKGMLHAERPLAPSHGPHLSTGMCSYPATVLLQHQRTVSPKTPPAPGQATHLSTGTRSTSSPWRDTSHTSTSPLAVPMNMWSSVTTGQLDPASAAAAAAVAAGFAACSSAPCGAGDSAGAAGGSHTDRPRLCAVAGSMTAPCMKAMLQQRSRSRCVHASCSRPAAAAAAATLMCYSIRAKAYLRAGT
jgi:hypothetical protein